MRSATPAEQWDKALELCKRGLLADGYADGTVTRVCKQVARFSRECGGWGPWDVDEGVIQGWLDRLQVSDRAGYAYRTSLRTFYRWATRTGRMSQDPTEDTSRRMIQRPAPDGWHAAISGYRRFLRSSRLSEQTIHLRCYQLVRVACELPASDPWQVTTQDLADWLGGHAWSRESVYSYRSVLRGFYGWAVTVGHVEVNPAQGLPTVRLRPPRPRTAPDEAYLEALRRADDRSRLMLRLAAEIGLRAGEIAAVHSDDMAIGADGAWWLHVVGKGDRARLIPLPDTLAAELRGLPEGYAFPGQIEGHLSRARVTSIVSALLPDEFTAHALRHRFATRAYLVDRDLFTVQQLLGHSSPITTRRYVNVPDSRMRALVVAAAT